MISTNGTLNLRNLFEHLPGSFGYVRKNHIHEGVDLYGEDGEEVYPFIAGVVIAVYDFTGASVGMPWWNETKAVAIADEAGVWVYGEISPVVNVGDVVTPSETIGRLKQVLKKDKGRPMTMLHVERWKGGYTPHTFLWNLGTPQPEFLLDPTQDLIELFNGR